MSLKVGRLCRLQKHSDDGSVEDERQDRRGAVLGIVIRLCANATAAGARRSSRTLRARGIRRCTGAGIRRGSAAIPGPTADGRIGTKGSYRQYSGGELPGPLAFVARGSRRSIDVLYWLS